MEHLFSSSHSFSYPIQSPPLMASEASNHPYESVNKKHTLIVRVQHVPLVHRIPALCEFPFGINVSRVNRGPNKNTKKSTIRVY